MELRQFKYFIRSAELLNFTEAAHSLYISQSTLSQQIKQLEDEMGMLLFDRIGKRVQLTEAGRTFLQFAHQSIQHAEQGKQLMEDLKGIKTGTLKIGVTYGLSTLLTSTIVAFSKKYSDIHINVDFGTSEDLLEKLKLGKLDFILSFIQINQPNLFELETLFESSMCLVVHPNHSISKKKKIAIRELKDIPLAMPTKGFSTRTLLDKIFEKHKIIPQVKIELNDINTLLQLVETGNWSTILTVASVKDRKNLKTITINEIDVMRKASVIWPKERYRKKAALVFTKMIQQQIDK